MHDASPAVPGGGRLEGMFNRIEQVLVLLSGLAILASGAITFISVFGRWAFGWAIPDGEIIVRDLMIVACVLPLSVVAGRHAHIAVDLVVRHFSERARRWVDLFNGYLGVLILAAITWSGWLNFASAWSSNGYYDGRLELPEWPARLVFFVGYLLFAARSLQRAGEAPSTGQSIPDGQDDRPHGDKRE
jgi:TRAP-type C4-dicarboxylate transport system permease small subunit